MGEPIGQMTFRHQDGDIVFPVKRALYAVDEEGRLTVSVSCGENPDASWMSQPCICLVEAPLPGPLAPGLVVRHAGNDEDWEDGSYPHAHVYVGFHAEPEDVTVTFIREAAGGWEVELSFLMEDVNYYSSKAQDNRVVCRCRVAPSNTDEMWIPL